MYGPGSWKQSWSLSWKNIVLLLTLTCWSLANILLKNSAETAGRWLKPRGTSGENNNKKAALVCNVAWKLWKKHLGKQSAPTNPLQLADILQYQDSFCPSSENLVFCTRCSADGWSASFILRFPGDDNPQHNGRRGNESAWKAFHHLNGYMEDSPTKHWSSSGSMIRGAVCSVCRCRIQINVNSVPWINETLEGKNDFIWSQVNSECLTACSGPQQVECPVCATKSPTSVFRNHSDFQVGDTSWWSLPTTSWAKFLQNVQASGQLHINFTKYQVRHE